MRFLPLTVLALAGCAPITSAGVYQTPVDFTISSAKPPKDFALCVSQKLFGNNPVSNDGDHYWVTRYNMQGAVWARWDFLPSQGGSIAQLRAAQVIGGSDKKQVQACA